MVSFSLSLSLSESRSKSEPEEAYYISSKLSFDLTLPEYTVQE